MPAASSARWVLVSDDQAFLEQPKIAEASVTIPDRAAVRAWTDDNSSLLPLIQWQGLQHQ